MGGFASKRRGRRCGRDKWSLSEKMRLVQEEINEMVFEREKERRAHEREVMVFAFKEAEWKRERRKLKEEVRRLRKMVKDKQEGISPGTKDGVLVAEKCEKDQWQLLGTAVLVEHMREERARRDEAVEKWKQLYLAIKTELDDLIQRTNGDGLFLRAEEEDMVEELRKEVKTKEETVQLLKAQVAAMEHEQRKKEREIDILRQSLRIMSSKKKPIPSAKSLYQYL